MSKIGKKPILIPEGVEIKMEWRNVIVKWPKGELSYEYLPGVDVKQEDNQIVVSIELDDHKNLRGLTRTLIANMIEGVTNGYEKKLLIMWVGYWAKMEGNNINLSLGLSHKVLFPVPDSIKVAVEQDPKGNTIITLNSIDKQFLWEVTAKIRALRKPEPYKGKGIRYIDEEVKLKAGKAAKK